MPTSPTREELLNTIEAEATQLERTYHGCSRCVLMPLQRHLGLGSADVARASAPLAGGIALTGETCGALLGGLLATGLALCSDELENRQAFMDTMGAGFRFARRFHKEFGATTCRELQTVRLGAYYSMAKPDEYEAFVKAGGYDVCAALVGKASRLAAQFLMELQDRGALRVGLTI